MGIDLFHEIKIMMEENPIKVLKTLFAWRNFFEIS
jgi:hypothetical protein